MNLNQKINLEEFEREAENAGCEVIRSDKGYCYAASPREIVIATTTGAIRVPTENARHFAIEYQIVTEIACRMWRELSLAEKNELAREKHMTYGEIQQVMYVLNLGGNHEQENR